MPVRITDASEPLLRDLFHEVHQFLGRSRPVAATVYAKTMQAVHERALVRPVSLLGSVGLLLMYCSGIVLFWIPVLGAVLRAAAARH